MLCTDASLPNYKLQTMCFNLATKWTSGRRAPLWQKIRLMDGLRAMAETKVGAATAQDQQLCDQNGSEVWRCACTAAIDAFAVGALVTLLVTKEMSTGGCDLGWSARLVMEARQRK